MALTRVATSRLVLVTGSEMTDQVRAPLQNGLGRVGEGVGGGAVVCCVSVVIGGPVVGAGGLGASVDGGGG